MIMRQLTRRCLFLIMPHPSDLSFCAFFLFPQLKRLMKGPGFATIKEIKIAERAQRATKKRLSKVVRGL